MSSTEPSPESPPAVTVIIPVYNDAAGLAQTVDSLLAAQMSHRDEIIIADNGSDDDTWQCARSYEDSRPRRVTAVREESIQSSYAARNRGIEEAGGDILAFVDADMTVPPDYFEAVRRRFDDEDVDYLACDVEITVEEPTAGSFYNCLTGFPIGAYLQRGHYAPTCCLCVRKEALERLGPFDSRLESGGDMEFGKRAHAAGLEQVFAPEIVLEHPARTSYRSLAAKQRRIGRGHAQLSHYHAERFSLLWELYVTPWKYFLPHNPFALWPKCRDQNLEVGLAVVVAIAFWRIPLAWAGLFAYLREARRLPETEQLRAERETS